MFDEYKRFQIERNNIHASYDVFKAVFKETGYKFKPPKLDTCRTCDEFILKIRKGNINKENKEQLQIKFDKHKKIPDFGYTKKKEDKEAALQNPSQRVIVFDQQKVLNTPSLT